MMVASSEADAAYPSTVNIFIPIFWRSTCFTILCFLCRLFVVLCFLFILAIAFLLWSIASYYPFRIFKAFLLVPLAFLHSVVFYFLFIPFAATTNTVKEKVASVVLIFLCQFNNNCNRLLLRSWWQKILTLSMKFNLQLTSYSRLRGFHGPNVIRNDCLKE